MVTALIVLLGFIGLIIIFITLHLLRMTAGKKLVAQELSLMSIKKLPPMGAVQTLSIMPLVDFYTDDPVLKTEAGVSYLIRADNTTILMDTGLNLRREHPSPLLHNMKALNVRPEDIDMIFISQLHLDHLRPDRFQIALIDHEMQSRADVKPGDVGDGAERMIHPRRDCFAGFDLKNQRL